MRLNNGGKSTNFRICQGKSTLRGQLQRELERSDSGRFVSIEPESADYFLGDTFDQAVSRALEKYPDRLTHTIRIGHRAALHMGAITR